MKKQLGASDAFFPVPTALIVSGEIDKPNIITIVWIGIVTSTPPTIGISMQKNRYSLDLIRKTKEFTVNIAGADIAKQADYCGMVTGQKRNKFTDTGLTPLKGAKVNTAIIKECPYNIECKVTQEIELGDWVLVLGEIVETHIDEDKIDTSAKNKIDIAKVNPLVYTAGVREYWQLGEIVGKGFQAGTEILKNVRD